MSVRIRRARPEDIEGIADLVEIHASRAQILPRTREAIHASIDDWVVAAEGAFVLACGSLMPYSPSLSEVRSLVVSDSEKRRGLGTALLQVLIEEARRRGVRTLFALTRAVPFFEKAGFRRSDRLPFSEKVWRDCVACPIQETCDEFAVVLSLNGTTSPGKAHPKARTGGD